MSFFNIFGEQRSSPSLENPNVSLSDPGAWATIFGSASSFAGEPVTEQTALAVPAVAAAINKISDAIASLPLQLFRRTEDGRAKADSDPLYRIVHDQVNADYLTSFAWRKWMVSRLLLRGRALTYIERNKAGRVMNLWPLDPDRVVIEIKGGRRVYRYRLADREVVYGAGEIVDLVWMPTGDGVGHHDPLIVNRNAIGLAIAAERYASTVFDASGVPPLVMSGPAMSPGAQERASTDVAAAVKAAKRERRGILTMPTGFDLKPIGFEPSKAQLLELRQFQILEIARVFGINPTFLQDLSNGTYSNTEQADISFAKHTLAPWIELIEQELNAKLFSDRNRSLFVEFNIDGMLRGDFATRMAGYATAIQNGIRTPNEVRALDNLPPSDQPDADKLHIQGATTPLGSQPQASPTAQAA